MTNPYVQILQRINRSSPRGNDKCINHQSELFVETYLHKYLSKEVLSGKYRLVLITGCSGDGKTEFIQWLEQWQMNAPFDLQEHPVGRIDWVEKDTRYFCTLYDAQMTYEEEDQGPEDLLNDNLADFEGEEWDEEPSCYRIFSIDRDHLRRFLDKNKERYPRLHRCVTPALDDLSPDQTHALKEGILVVDLTFRSLVGDILREDGLENGCVISKLIDRLCADDYWRACESCEVNKFCPILSNIRSLNPKNGMPVAERLKMLLTAFHYRRIFHLTMRDAVSLLVNAFVTDATCEDIIRERGYSEYIFPLFYFNRLQTFDGQFGNLLDELDIASVSAPRVDQRILSESDLEINSRSLPAVAIREMLNSVRDDASNGESNGLGKLLASGRKRRIFFEDTFEGTGSWRELFPYRSFAHFDEIVKKAVAPDTLVPQLLRAISVRDGLVMEDPSCFYFTLDSSSERLATYYRAPIKDFEALLPLPRTIEGHREYLPGYILLRHKSRHDIALRVNLDIIEHLLFGSSNLPGKPDYSSELTHRLRVFKEKLESMLELGAFIIRTENGTVAEISRTGISGGDIRILTEGKA